MCDCSWAQQAGACAGGSDGSECWYTCCLMPTHALHMQRDTTRDGKGLFFYQHIAKTGGTSWSDDIATTSPLRHCGNSHLVGPDSVNQLNRTLLWRLAQSVKTDSRTQCNLFNREDGLQTTLRVFASLGATPKLILMLRSPTTHVRSMYSHCQAPSGFLRRQREAAGTFHPISLGSWLRLFANTSSPWGQGGWRYCYYNPVNYQAHLLAANPGSNFNGDRPFPTGRFHFPTHTLDRVLALVQSSYFVAITEYYAHSLCLLRWRLTGQLPASDCAARIKTSHTDYGNGAHQLVLSVEELSLIEQVSHIDTQLHGVGLDRLSHDAHKASFQLLR